MTQMVIHMTFIIYKKQEFSEQKIIKISTVALGILREIQNVQTHKELRIRTKSHIEMIMNNEHWVFQHDHAPVHTAPFIGGLMNKTSMSWIARASHEI